ncbi:hypothetical protein [Streptomyces sp. NRRL B-24572]|uniref:hypothetical protein n=1 Tax=Streptomyces sp. NRRL B-24572 TaxID=1962156 RepID=UPI000A3B32DA|nr:hypothetical protein [Streptomyces sp. NRRL B-24572]
MASITHTLTDGHRRRTPGRTSAVAGERSSRSTASAEGRAWPTDTQVWGWAQNAMLGGYGPSAPSFL